MMCLGDVVALDEDSADLSGFRNYRFIDEVEQALLHPAVRSPKAHGHMLCHVALTRRVNLIKKLKEPLSADFRQGLSHGPAGYVATVDEPHIGFVDKLKNVLGPTQNGDEARTAFEQAPLPFGLRGETLLSEHLLRRFGANDEDTANPFRRCLVIDRPVTISPVDVLTSAIPRDRHKLVFVPGRTAPGHHLLDLWANDLPNLIPHFAS